MTALYFILVTLAVIGAVSSTVDAWRTRTHRTSAQRATESHPMLPGGAGPPTSS